jgi:hypothetical protein
MSKEEESYAGKLDAWGDTHSAEWWGAFYGARYDAFAAQFFAWKEKKAGSLLQGRLISQQEYGRRKMLRNGELAGMADSMMCGLDALADAQEGGLISNQNMVRSNNGIGNIPWVVVRYQLFANIGGTAVDGFFAGSPPTKEMIDTIDQIPELYWARWPLMLRRQDWNKFRNRSPAGGNPVVKAVAAPIAAAAAAVSAPIVQAARALAGSPPGGPAVGGQGGGYARAGPRPHWASRLAVPYPAPVPTPGARPIPSWPHPLAAYALPRRNRFPAPSRRAGFDGIPHLAIGPTMWSSSSPLPRTTRAIRRRA